MSRIERDSRDVSRWRQANVLGGNLTVVAEAEDPHDTFARHSRVCIESPCAIPRPSTVDAACLR